MTAQRLLDALRVLAHAAELEFDPDRFDLTAAGVPVPLSPAERDLIASVWPLLEPEAGQ